MQSVTEYNSVHQINQRNVFGMNVWRFAMHGIFLLLA